jgi:alkanesulfonate monooxygenase SsuD/methylene tetrahydromethanopterin reductase-like flavin-dependent oxidoreductase (luciferase family)
MVELDDQDPVTKYNGLIDSDAFCVGDPASVIRKIEAYRAIGGDRLVSVMQTADLPHEDLLQSIELFGTKVIPHFRALDAVS